MVKHEPSSSISPIKEFPESGGRVKGGYFAGATQWIANVLKPDDLAVRGIQEGHPKSLSILGNRLAYPLRVPRSLCEHVLRADGHSLGLNHPFHLAVDNECVVGRTVVGRKLGDRLV